MTDVTERGWAVGSFPEPLHTGGDISISIGRGSNGASTCCSPFNLIPCSVSDGEKVLGNVGVRGLAFRGLWFDDVLLDNKNGEGRSEDYRQPR